MVVGRAFPVALVATLLLSACRDQESAKPPNEIIVGAVLPLSGPLAAFGKSSRHALEMAKEDIAAGDSGLRITLRFEDSEANPTTGVSAYQRLRQVSNVRFVVASVSSVVLALKPWVARDSVLLFANAAHPDVTSNTRSVFQYSNTIESEVDAIIAYLPSSSDARIAIVANNDDYGKVYAERLGEKLAASADAKGTVVATAFVERATLDFRTLLLRVRRSRPTMYVVIGSGRSLGLLIRQLREGGFSGPFVASLGMLVTRDALEAAGPALRGGAVVNYTALANPEVQRLRERYEAGVGETPSPSIILDYALLYAIAYGVRGAGSSPGKVADLLRSVGELATPIGPLVVGKGNTVTAAVRVMRFPNRAPVDPWRIQ